MNCRFSLHLMWLTLPLLAACQATTTTPSNKLVVAVRVPNETDDNPLGSPAAKYIGLIADGWGTLANSVYTVQPYVSNSQVQVPSVSFGSGQIRVEVYDGNNLGATTTIARGASVPVNVSASSAPRTVFPYVTKINHFSNIYFEPGNDTKLTLPPLDSTASPDDPAGKPVPHVATALATLPSGFVLMTGGAVPKTGAKNPYDPASYSAFKSTVQIYNPDLRTLTAVSDPPAQLATARAFHSMAVGQTVVAIVGGVELDENGKPHASNKIEFYNMTTGEITSAPTSEPNLKFARIAPTVVQMFDRQDYFLVLGGKGNEDCPASPDLGQCAGNTWEIWHPTGGRQPLDGQMKAARWHHGGVRVPGPDGGYVMLVGGENSNGPLQTMEVVQFLVHQNQVMVSNSQLACPADCPKNPDKPDDPINSFLYQPLDPALREPRIWPGVLFVAHPSTTPSEAYYHVYMAGGFSKQDHTQVSKTVDIFDIQSSAYLNSSEPSPQMAQGRASPILAAVTTGPSAGEVLLAGGSTGDSAHLKSSEFLRIDASGGLHGVIAPVDGLLPDGDRTLGAAIGLNTGHVLILGGTGGTVNGLTPRTDVLLWNPY